MPLQITQSSACLQETALIDVNWRRTEDAVTSRKAKPSTSGATRTATRTRPLPAGTKDTPVVHPLAPTLFSVWRQPVTWLITVSTAASPSQETCPTVIRHWHRHTIWLSSSSVSYFCRIVFLILLCHLWWLQYIKFKPSLDEIDKGEKTFCLFRHKKTLFAVYAIITLRQNQSFCLD